MAGFSIPVMSQPDLARNLAHIANVGPMALQAWIEHAFRTCAGRITAVSLSAAAVEDWVVAGDSNAACVDPGAQVCACALQASGRAPCWDSADGARCLVVTLLHPNGAHVQLRLDPDGVQVCVPHCVPPQPLVAAVASCVSAAPTSSAGTQASGVGSPCVPLRVSGVVTAQGGAGGAWGTGTGTPSGSSGCRTGPGGSAASMSDAPYHGQGCRYRPAPLRLRPAVDAAQALVFWKTALLQSNASPAHPDDVLPAAQWIAGYIVSHFPQTPPPWVVYPSGMLRSATPGCTDTLELDADDPHVLAMFDRHVIWDWKTQTLVAAHQYVLDFETSAHARARLILDHQQAPSFPRP